MQIRMHTVGRKCRQAFEPLGTKHSGITALNVIGRFNSIAF